MKIVPQEGATIAQPATAKAAESSLERAKAAFMRPTTASQAAAQEHPVLDPTNVSPEEFTAVKSPTKGHSDNIETPVSEEAKADTKAPEEPLSSQYAVLARKEKALRAKDQQLRAREAAVKAKEESKSSLEPAKPSFDESKYISRDKLASDPFSALAELGISYDQLTNLALNAPKPEEIAVNNEIKALRDELKSLRGEQETARKSFQEQQEQSYKQAIDQMKHETKTLVTRDPSFEMIRSTGSVSDVVELIEETFSKGMGSEYPKGTLLSVEEAAQMVEDYLTEEATKISRIKKVQERLRPAVNTAPARKSEPTKQSQPLKTLTNSVGTSRQLSARERALLAFEGKLTK